MVEAHDRQVGHDIVAVCDAEVVGDLLVVPDREKSHPHAADRIKF